MTNYFHLATQLKEAFIKFELRHVVRENNKRANLLSKLTNIEKCGQSKTVVQKTISTLSLDKIMTSVTPINQESMAEIQDLLNK